MEILLIIGGIWLLGVIMDYTGKNKPENRNNRSSHTSSTNTDSETKQNTSTFRPSGQSRRNSSISFKTSSSSSTGDSLSETDLDGLHDAFTGAPLDKNLGLHQCQSCKVYYHTESIQVLREANNSQCVSCQSTNIVAVIGVSKSKGGRDYTPDVVTLDNYKQHVGSVVTFEGIVSKVNESRRGNDFAVMFENKSWIKGFKLVFFHSAVRKVGGSSYINSLAGKRIKVRGLVINHPKFGYEIIISEKTMILSVK